MNKFLALALIVISLTSNVHAELIGGYNVKKLTDLDQIGVLYTIDTKYDSFLGIYAKNTGHTLCTKPIQKDTLMCIRQSEKNKVFLDLFGTKIYSSRQILQFDCEKYLMRTKYVSMHQKPFGQGDTLSYAAADDDWVSFMGKNDSSFQLGFLGCAIIDSEINKKLK